MVVKKVTFPSQTPQNVVVICNTTIEGCSIPPIALKSQSSSTQLRENSIDESDSNESGAGNILQGNKLINTLSIITTSPVLYIQRLRKRFEDGSNNRTKREKRDASFERGKARYIYSELDDNIHGKSTETESSTDYTSQESSNLEMIPEPMFYPERKVRQKHKKKYTEIIIEDKPSRMNKMAHYDELKNATNIGKYVLKNKTSKNSRSDVFNSKESNVDYIQTTKNDRGGSGHYSLFKNPVYDNNDDYDEDIILGGSHRQHDGTTPIPIVDADHDYDSEFEYVQLDNQGSRETEENENSNYAEANEDKSNQHSEEDNGGDEERDEEVSNEDENEGSEEIVKYPPVVVVYKGDPKDDYHNSQIEPNLDIHERYITKDPLAGPGATRGFNHDYTILRRVPAQGGGVIQQNTRFPTVPGFNTSEIHNIIKIGRLPGVTGIGPNFTKIGITPIEPARHAMPNDFGEYLGLHGLYGSSDPPRRPVMNKRPQYHGRRPIYNGYPVKSHRVVLRRPGTYRQPVRLSSQMSYPVRSHYRTHPYRPNNIGPKHLLRIKIIEDRSSDGDPEETVKTSEEENLRGPTGEYTYRQEEAHDNDDFENEDKSDEHLQYKNSYDPTNKSYNVRNNKKPAHTPHRYMKKSENNNSSINKQGRPNTDFKRIVQTPTSLEEYKMNKKPIYRIKTPKIRRPKNPPKSKMNTSPYYDKISSVSVDSYDEDNFEERNSNPPKINNEEEHHNKNVENNPEEESIENTNSDHEDEHPLESQYEENNEHEHPPESQSEEKNEELENSSTLRTTSKEMSSYQGENNDGSSHEEEEDISSTLSKLIQRTEDIQNDKMTPNGEEPISYNNYWTLEYSLPNFR